MDSLSHRAICTRKISFEEQVGKRNMGNDSTEILWYLAWSSFRKIFIDDIVLFGFFTVTLIYMSLFLLPNEVVIQLCSQRSGTAGIRNIWPRLLCPWWKFADQLLQSRSLWQILTDGQEQLEYTKQTVFKAVFKNIHPPRCHLQLSYAFCELYLMHSVGRIWQSQIYGEGTGL